jgi:hypothetical protein
MLLQLLEDRCHVFINNLLTLLLNLDYLPQVGGFPRELRFPPPIKVTATRGVTMLDSSRDVPIHKFDKSALITDALYNFRTSLSVVVSFLETPKSDHDEKVALYLNAILKFDFIRSRPSLRECMVVAFLSIYL